MNHSTNRESNTIGRRNKLVLGEDYSGGVVNNVTLAVPCWRVNRTPLENTRTDNGTSDEDGYPANEEDDE